MLSACFSSLRGLGPGLGLALVCLLLNACATRVAAPVDDLKSSLSQDYYERLAMINTWRMHGKLAVRHGDASWQIGLRWRHSTLEDAVQVFDLMGRQVLDARGNQHSMQVRDNRGNSYQNVPTADFIEELIGKPLPPDSLSSWISGRIWPKAEAQVLAADAEGRIVRMRQLGWTIHYSDYQRHAYGLMMPGRIVCENADFRLTVLSHRWYLCMEPGECLHV